MLGINTLGVLYIVEKGNTVQNVADLKGKTIYTTGKGTTPEYTLKYLLKKAGLDAEKDVNIEFKSEASEAAAMLASSDSGAVAMLPQPYVTTVMAANSDVRIALDVTKEWENLSTDGSTVVTGVIAVNADYYEKNKAAVAKFMEEYENSVDFVNDELTNAFEKGANDYLIVNASNIRPHAYFLDAVRRIWFGEDVSGEEHSEKFCGKYFDYVDGISWCYDEYTDSMLKYGEHEEMLIRRVPQ